MKIEKNKPLRSYNTFGIDVFSNYFVAIKSEADLKLLIGSDIFLQNKRLILGGGSNILFTDNFDGITIHPSITDLEIIHENKDQVTIKAGSGLEWDKLVEFCVSRNWGGIENLSDIPGKVGAAPVQNIGAYGTEAKDTIEKVYAVDLKNGESRVFSRSECNFGYRYSIFKKNEYKDFLITHVDFSLNKKPILSTSYGSINEELDKLDKKDIRAVRQVIQKIRKSKLPPVSEVASAGSFFKNPVVDRQKINLLKQDYPGLPEFKVNDRQIKIPAAWLIEQCGFKGYTIGRVGTYKEQPLVIINHGGATGKEVISFSAMIREKVANKFGILLEPEVCFV
jgi:UDP-N-acetylmuramate dehydrogenase